MRILVFPWVFLHVVKEVVHSDESAEKQLHVGRSHVEHRDNNTKTSSLDLGLECKAPRLIFDFHNIDLGPFLLIGDHFHCCSQLVLTAPQVATEINHCRLNEV